MNASDHAVSRYLLRVNSRSMEPGRDIIEMYNSSREAEDAELELFGARRIEEYSYRIGTSAGDGACYLLIASNYDIVTVRGRAEDCRVDRIRELKEKRRA